jgi:acetyl-CoA acetyltransferase
VDEVVLGAAALVVASSTAVREHGLEPRAGIAAVASAGFAGTLRRRVRAPERRDGEVTKLGRAPPHDDG